MDPRDLWRGLRVIWRHKPRGGYGFVLKIPAKVLHVTRKRVTIEVETDQRGPKTVSVDPANLLEMTRDAITSEADTRKGDEG